MTHIPEKSIEAAARAWHDETERSFIHPGDELTPWDDESQRVKDGYILAVRPLLEAAVPFIAALAWDQGYDSGVNDAKDKLARGHDPRFMSPRNPYRRGTA